jgi:hypothetical protein
LSLQQSSGLFGKQVTFTHPFGPFAASQSDFDWYPQVAQSQRLLLTFAHSFQQSEFVTQQGSAFAPSFFRQST